MTQEVAVRKKTAIGTFKGFDDDEKARAIVDVMLHEDYQELSSVARANRAGVSLQEYNAYLANPEFLDWSTKRLKRLYKAKLPEVMQTVYQQAVQGSAKQQRMLLEFMDVLESKQGENRNPNIVIVNNIPDPDKTPDLKVINHD